jgi:hypothetical protein
MYITGCRSFYYFPVGGVASLKSLWMKNLMQNNSHICRICFSTILFTQEDTGSQTDLRTSAMCAPHVTHHTRKADEQF